ncbi:MAG: hypothetical protein QM775_24435 [Pirellulales bacterium]
MTRLLQILVGIVVLAVWTVVGTVLYIPLLARQVAVYSVVLSAASLGRGTIHQAQTALERAIEFLPNGFRIVSQTIRGNNVATSNSPYSNRAPSVGFSYLIIEIAWSAIFWGSIFFAVKHMAGPTA